MGRCCTPPSCCADLLPLAGQMASPAKSLEIILFMQNKTWSTSWHAGSPQYRDKTAAPLVQKSMLIQHCPCCFFVCFIVFLFVCLRAKATGLSPMPIFQSASCPREWCCMKDRCCSSKLEEWCLRICKIQEAIMRGECLRKQKQAESLLSLTAPWMDRRRGMGSQHV